MKLLNNLYLHTLMRRKNKMKTKEIRKYHNYNIEVMFEEVPKEINECPFQCIISLEYNGSHFAAVEYGENKEKAYNKAIDYLENNLIDNAKGRWIPVLQRQMEQALLKQTNAKQILNDTFIHLSF